MNTSVFELTNFNKISKKPKVISSFAKNKGSEA